MCNCGNCDPLEIPEVDSIVCRNCHHEVSELMYQNALKARRAILNK